MNKWNPPQGAYKAPFFLKSSGHLQTIVPSFWQRPSIDYVRKRISVDNNTDFLDIDFHPEFWRNTGEVVVLCHGFEGSSQSKYIMHWAQALSELNYRVVAYNARSCSGEVNATKVYYHSAKIDDLQAALNYLNQEEKIESFYLVGFSLGANLVLKYGASLAKLNTLPAIKLKKLVVVSAPTDLKACSLQIGKGWANAIYTKVFLSSLFKKLKEKERLGIDVYNWEELNKINSIYDFDDKITAPLHGFSSADDYYEKASSINDWHLINVPTVVISALNDSMLAPSCYAAAPNNFVKVIYSKEGGHTFFPQSERGSWALSLAKDFLNF